MLTAMTANAQTDYRIDGKVKPETKRVYIVDIANRYTAIDSADVVKYEFTMKGTQPTNAILGISDGSYVTPFINDGTPIAIDLATSYTVASEQNKKLRAYDLELSPIDQQMNDCVVTMRSRGAQLSELEKDSVIHYYEMLANKRSALVEKIIYENTDNMIPAVYVSDIAYDLDYDALCRLCNPAFAFYNHPAMKLPRRLKENMEKRAPGKLFTDMTISDMNGTEHKLSEWIGHGQYVMIDFWASWCGPCRGEMPNVVANYQKYHSKGFEIIGISFDQKAESWKNAVAQMNMTWPQLSDLGGWKSAAAGVYGISSIPASILFDGTGHIVATDLRGEALGAKLHEIYGF